MMPKVKEKFVREFDGRRTVQVYHAGREQPGEGMGELRFYGVGVALCKETREVGLALDPKFSNKHRFTWAGKFQGKNVQLADLDADKFAVQPEKTASNPNPESPTALADFRWYDFLTLHDTLRVPPGALRYRIETNQSAASLAKPEGHDRLAIARIEGVTWKGETKSIPAWCEALGLGYATLCARLANPRMKMAAVMHSGRVLGAFQKKFIITPELRAQLAANGVSYNTFYQRIKAEWPEHLAVQPTRRYAVNNYAKVQKEKRELLGALHDEAAARKADPDYVPELAEVRYYESSAAPVPETFDIRIPPVAAQRAPEPPLDMQAMLAQLGEQA